MRTASVCLLILAGFLPGFAAAQNTRFHGQATDISSKKPISGVQVAVMNDGRKSHLDSSRIDGVFSFAGPLAGTALVIEKKGYRTIQIALPKQPDVAGKVDFRFGLPMIPMDAQATDKPYMQSEQKDFVLESVAPEKKKVTRQFRVFDALAGEAIPASVCLEFTKVEKRDCKEITGEGWKVVFGEADIISVVVEAAGYQTYRGNLILDKVDGSVLTYDIRMTPEVNLLALHVTGPKTIAHAVLVPPGKNGIPMVNNGADGFYALVNDGNYMLVIGDKVGTRLHTEQVQVMKGLNYRIIAVSNKPPEPAQTAPKTVVSRPVETIPVGETYADTIRNVTLYFGQSEHALLPEAKVQLDKLVGWLQGGSDRKIRIIGHSDNVGDPKRNETLSEYRARVTYNYLQQKGISAQQMFWVGIGSKKPAGSNDTEENKKKNRRVEITLIRGNNE